MTKIIVKAVNRELPDDIGDYLWECLKGAGTDLDVELVRLPTELWDYKNPKNAGQQEVAWVNQQDADAFLFFSNWIGGGRYRDVASAYKKMDCKCVYWSREDPNHYSIFLTDTRFADVIATCASECVTQYQGLYQESKKVINLPMALADEVFYPAAPEHEPEWDIVFLGNRYTRRNVRNRGEECVVMEAARWAVAHDKKMAIWGLKDSAYGWESVSKLFTTGIFQGSRVGRLDAADVYRNARVALSVASNSDSPTMAPNRVVQIAGSGIPLIAFDSLATNWQTGGFANISYSKADTRNYLDEIFFTKQKHHTNRAQKAKRHVLNNHTFSHRLHTILEAIK